jgi:hypothetical protein
MRGILFYGAKGKKKKTEKGSAEFPTPSLLDFLGAPQICLTDPRDPLLGGEQEKYNQELGRIAL